jgi:hypothetical protein
VRVAEAFCHEGGTTEWLDLYDFVPCGTEFFIYVYLGGYEEWITVKH